MVTKKDCNIRGLFYIDSESDSSGLIIGAMNNIVFLQ